MKDFETGGKWFINNEDVYLISEILISLGWKIIVKKFTDNIDIIIFTI